MEKFLGLLGILLKFQPILVFLFTVNLVLNCAKHSEKESSRKSVKEELPKAQPWKPPPTKQTPIVTATALNRPQGFVTKDSSKRGSITEDPPPPPSSAFSVSTSAKRRQGTNPEPSCQSVLKSNGSNETYNSERADNHERDNTSETRKKTID